MYTIPGPMCLTSSLYTFSKHWPPHARHLEFKGPYRFGATPFSTEHLQSPMRGCSLKNLVSFDTRDAMFPRGARRDSKGERSPLLLFDMRPDSLGESGMQT